MKTNTQIITRKIKLCPIGNKEEIHRVYQFIRNGQYAQWKASNQYMSALYIAAINEVSKEDRAELNHLYTRINSNKNGSAYDKDIKFAIGVNTTSFLSQYIPADFKKACQDGLLKGTVGLPVYKRNAPLWTASKHLIFLHGYELYQDFLDNLYSNDLKINMKWVNKINFEVVLGNPHKSAELRSIFKNIFEETYKICNSSIQIDGKSIILNLTLQIPIQEIELDESTVVGVDLGIAVPAVCALNNNDYIRKSIGCVDDFVRIRTKIQAQKRRLQKSLKYSNGGHGRKKKLAPLNKFSKYERNWVKTYNHMVSKNVIEFAVKNKAKYINLEDLSGYNSNDFILRNWSYYSLQQQIVYKANMYGIEVRFINPYHTSQTCSCCGHWEEGQRIDQAHFKCKKCGNEMNADFNAARNIAISSDFVK